VAIYIYKYVNKYNIYRYKYLFIILNESGTTRLGSDVCWFICQKDMIHITELFKEEDLGIKNN